MHHGKFLMDLTPGYVLTSEIENNLFKLFLNKSDLNHLKKSDQIQYEEPFVPGFMNLLTSGYLDPLHNFLFSKCWKFFSGILLSATYVLYGTVPTVHTVHRKKIGHNGFPSDCLQEGSSHA